MKRHLTIPNAKRLLTRKPAAIAAVLVILAGGAVGAVAATSGSSSPSKQSLALASGPARLDSAGRGTATARHRAVSRELAAAASYLHLSVKQLRAQLRHGRSLADIARATPGRSESGLIEAILAAKQNKLARAAQRLAQRVTTQVRSPGGPGTRVRLYSVSHTVRTYLGLRATQLRRELRSGKTLVQIVQATPGKSVSGLIAALLQPRKQALEAQAKAGRLTPTAESARVAQLERRFNALVNRVQRERSTRSGTVRAF